MKGSEGRSVVFNFLQPHGLYGPWNSPGQNTGVGSLSLLQGIFPTQGSNPGLPHYRWILYQLSHKGSPLFLMVLIYSACASSSWEENHQRRGPSPPWCPGLTCTSTVTFRLLLAAAASLAFFSCSSCSRCSARRCCSSWGPETAGGRMSQTRGVRSPPLRQPQHSQAGTAAPARTTGARPPQPRAQCRARGSHTPGPPLPFSSSPPAPAATAPSVTARPSLSPAAPWGPRQSTSGWEAEPLFVPAREARPPGPLAGRARQLRASSYTGGWRAHPTGWGCWASGPPSWGPLLHNPAPRSYLLYDGNPAPFLQSWQESEMRSSESLPLILTTGPHPGLTWSRAGLLTGHLRVLAWMTLNKSRNLSEPVCPSGGGAAGVPAIGLNKEMGGRRIAANHMTTKPLSVPSKPPVLPSTHPILKLHQLPPSAPFPGSCLWLCPQVKGHLCANHQAWETALMQWAPWQWTPHARGPPHQGYPT